MTNCSMILNIMVILNECNDINFMQTISFTRDWLIDNFREHKVSNWQKKKKS